MKRKTQEDYFGDLDSADLQTKLKALEKLGKSKTVSSKVIFRTISLLNDHNWKIRARAARALGNIGQRAEVSIKYLIDTLDDEKVGTVRADVILALGRMGQKAKPAVPKLIKALSDSSYTIRVAACGALGSIGPAADTAVRDLWKIVANTDNFTEQYCAWEAIKAIFSDELTIETLARYVAVEDLPMKNPFSGELKSRLKEKKPPTKKTIERYILDLDNGDPKKRSAAMRKLSDVVGMKQENLDSLITLSIPIIIALLSDSSWKVRSWSARLLGRIGSQAEIAIPNLSIALQDQMSTVRACAAYALGLMGEKAEVSIPDLELALHDPNQHVRNCAHMSLTRLDHIRNLSEKMDDDDELDWYEVNDEEIGVHYSVVGFKERIPPVIINQFDDDIKENVNSINAETNAELLKTLKMLRSDPTVVLNLYYELFNAQLWVLVQQPVLSIEEMHYLIYPTRDGVYELPAFAARDSALLAQLASQAVDAEILQIEGKRLWPGVLSIVRTGECEVAVDPGEAHGIRLTREMILSMVSKFGSNAVG